MTADNFPKELTQLKQWICWRMEKDKNHIPMTNVKRREKGDIAVLEYDHVVATMPTSAHIHAYLAKDDIWIEVYIHGLAVNDDDHTKHRAIFETIINGIKIEPVKTEPEKAPAK